MWPVLPGMYYQLNYIMRSIISSMDSGRELLLLRKEVFFKRAGQFLKKNIVWHKNLLRMIHSVLKRDNNIQRKKPTHYCLIGKL